MQRPNEQQQRLPSWAINYPVPPSTNQYRLLLAQYHKVPTSTTTYCPSTTKYQPVPPCTDQVSSYINHYHPKLTQYHQVPARTGPESPRTNQYCPILTQYHHEYPVPPCRDNQNIWHFMENELFTYSVFQTHLSDFPLSTWDEHSCTLV